MVRAVLVVALAAALLAQTAAATAPLAPCSVRGTAARCGTLSVPENRALPDGPTIELAVAVLPATGKPARPDPLFYITGGPGGAARDDLAGVATFWPAVNAHRDVVFVDQRGVGASNPLRCTLELTAGWSVADYVRSCLLKTPADVLQYRTPVAMDDLDAVRAWLGYARVNVFGISYGATAAQVYLNRHPETIRSVILDGVTLLDVPVFERWAASAQRALVLLRKRCAADRSCARRYPRWYEGLLPLLDRLDRKPLEISVAGAPTTVDGSLAASVVHELTASPYDAAGVPSLLWNAEHGRTTALARATAAVLSGTARPNNVMPTTITCTEPWAVQDPARVEAASRGSYLYRSATASAQSTAEVCAAWPRPDIASEDWKRPRGSTPVLVLVGGADPKDPPANSAGIERSLPNARTLVVPGGGHGVSTAGCVPRVLDRFLERGTAQGLDTSCVALTPFPPFR
jgi:pimeloyl-ACP methyl ester carboxylesterase